MTDAVRGAEELARQGKVREVFPRVHAAASAGDAEACLLLARWRLAGDWIRRDLVEARTWFGMAARAGHPEAAGPFLAMMANGAGGIAPDWPAALALLKSLAATDDFAARQVSLIETMKLDGRGDPQRRFEDRPLAQIPDVRTIAGFMAAAECDYLLEVSGPALQPAMVQDSRDGRLKRDPVRTSLTTAFPITAEDAVVHALNRRIARATGTDVRQGEPMQVLQYYPGQEYKMHSDALVGVPNQRILTCLVYLDEDFDGGETYFPAIGLKFRGRRGDALIFRSVDEAGRPEPAARHAGLPVTQGKKSILSRWIRAEPISLSGPPGRPF